MSLADVYDCARQNGVSHERALDAVERGTFVCWCGRALGSIYPPCFGGAQRFVGCPVLFEATSTRPASSPDKEKAASNA